MTEPNMASFHGISSPAGSPSRSSYPGLSANVPSPHSKQLV
jgi:hypothetical protein